MVPVVIGEEDKNSVKRYDDPDLRYSQTLENLGSLEAGKDVREENPSAERSVTEQPHSLDRRGREQVELARDPDLTPERKEMVFCYLL